MSNWKFAKLSTLCSRIGDGLHGTPEYTNDSDIFFINGNNLKFGKIEISENTKQVSVGELDKNIIPLNSNSLLLSINGTLGSMAFYKGEKVILGKSAAYLNFKSEINKFYYYYFQLPQIQKYFYDVATGSTIKNLSLKSIQDFEVPVPETDEWQKIASVLSSLDAKIELNNRINTELEAMAKTLYDYWFVQFDFPNAEGKPYKSSGGRMVWSEELKREIPQGWEVRELKGLVSSLVRGVSPKYIDEGGIVVLNQRCIRDKSINPTFGRRHDYLSKKVDSKLIAKGDILVNSTGVGTLGRAAIVKELPEVLTTVDSHVTIVRIDETKANPLFTGYNLLQKEREIESLGEGSTGQTELSRENLGKLKIILPTNNLQERFASFLEPIFQNIATNEQENQQLAHLRDWLLPMLMNGQVVVE